MSGVAAVTPWSFNAGVRLSDCSLLPVPLAKNGPVHRCCRRSCGTMFITSPAVSDSPRPPAVVNVTSCGVADVDDVAGRRIAARRAADVQSVEREAAFVGPAAVNRELTWSPCP